MNPKNKRIQKSLSKLFFMQEGKIAYFGYLLTEGSQRPKKVKAMLNSKTPRSWKQVTFFIASRDGQLLERRKAQEKLYH